MNIEEVKEYCQQRNNNIDPEYFIDYYETKDWLIGKTKMKDWKACVRTWEKRDFNKQNIKQPIRQEVVPEWFDKEHKAEALTDEEQKEMEALMSKFKEPFEDRKTALQEKLKAKYGKKGNDE